MIARKKKNQIIEHPPKKIIVSIKTFSLSLTIIAFPITNDSFKAELSHCYYIISSSNEARDKSSISRVPLTHFTHVSIYLEYFSNLCEIYLV